MAAIDIVKTIEAVFEGVATIQTLTNTGGDKAAEALTAIALVCEAIQEAVSGKTSPEVVLAQLKTHQDALAAGDAAAEQAVHDKFDTKGP